MLRLEMENYNMQLTEKQEIYKHYHQGKQINMNIYE